MNKIMLPKTLPKRKILSLDIGGTLAKVVFHVPKDDPVRNESAIFNKIREDTITIETESGDELFLKAFPSHKIIEYLEFVNQNRLVEDGGIIHATGGGSYKYQPEMETMFKPRDVKINKYDEMHSLVRGMTFLNTYVKNASYSVTEKRIRQEVSGSEEADESQILVSIGSGVSIIKVSGINSFQRVSGTMIGGGTLIGLSNLMTGVTDFDEIIDLASQGDHSKVDMMVRDIYGDNSPFAELHGDLLASSFAKIANDHSSGNMKEKYKREDILASLVCMISFNIGQLAYFQAHLHKCPKIYFVGNFVRNNILGMANLRKIVDLMQSQQSIESRFMKHDGYIGALGAFMNDL